jgi:hypothetical protein
MVAIMPRHFPHFVPAALAIPTASTVRAPERITARIVLSLTAWHRHTNMRPPPYANRIEVRPGR